jgi:nucleoid-associated protein YgaU
MIGLQRTARVICTVLIEAVSVAALVAIGRRGDLRVPVGRLGAWLRHGDPATVVVALLWWIALLIAVWLLVTTLLYVAAAVSRVPAAIRAVGWTTLPALRRAVDAACAVSLATTVVLVPAAAGAARASDPPTVSLVRDGHGGGITELPADSPTTTTTTTTPSTPTLPSLPPVPTRAEAPVAPVAPAPPRAPADEIVVVEGDNLWALSARHLAAATGRAVGDVPDTDVARYWVQVCDVNRARLQSGDPNLVYPGERIVLPPVS